MPDFGLEGRVALVTGGSGRLGVAFGGALAEAGATVVLNGRDPGRLSAAKARAGAVGAIAADVTDEEAVAGLFERVSADHGGLDVLVSAAGTAVDAPLGEISAADMAGVFAVNVTGALLCAQAAAPLMRAHGGGRILNIGSVYGSAASKPPLYEGSPGMVRACAPYIAAKSALVNLTRELAARLGPDGIQVNLLSPGGIAADQPEDFRRRYSERTLAGRMAEPADLTGPCVFLCSDAARYVTGQNLIVDGGFTLT